MARLLFILLIILPLAFFGQDTTKQLPDSVDDTELVEPKPQIEEEPDTQNNEHTNSGWPGDVGITDYLMLLFTATLAITAIYQGRQIRKANKVSERAAESVIDSERGRLYATEAELALIEGENLVDWSIMNVGRTPCVLNGYCTHCSEIRDKSEPIFEMEAHKRKRGMDYVIPVNTKKSSEDNALNYCNTRLTEEQVDSLEGGDKVLYFVGHIVYTTVFERTYYKMFTLVTSGQFDELGKMRFQTVPGKKYNYEKDITDEREVKVEIRTRPNNV